MNNNKSFDDYVYEDDFYNDIINKDEENLKKQENINIEENEPAEPIEIICVCEECDNRWDETKKTEDSSLFCPYCGSNKIIEI